MNGTSLGQANYLPRIEPAERRFQFQDNGTWVKGAHTIKFGTDIATTKDYVYYISNYYGSYTYQTVNAFALDYSGNTSGEKHWQSYSQTFGNPVVDDKINDYGFYLQDQWRATDRLTLSYGARYEYAQLPQPKVCNPDYPATCHLPSSPTNLAPRLGLTYRLNDKTVLQAGFGMFYARFAFGTIDNLFTTGNGNVQTSISLAATQSAQLAAGPVFPNTLSAPPSSANVSATNLQMVDQNLKTPYSEQGNIGIQRQLPLDSALTVSYIWSRGLQLYGVRDLNFPMATTDFTYTIADAAGNPVGTYTTPVYTGSRPDKRYNTVAYVENGVNSYYNGLAVQLDKRFSHGFQALGSYTWSHEIDDGQDYGGSTNNLWLTSASYWLYNGNYKADKGTGKLDQRHRFVLSWVWNPTFTKRTDALSKYLVNNWQLSSITTLQSGHPYGSTTVYMTDKPVTEYVLQLHAQRLGPEFAGSVGGSERLLLSGVLSLRCARQQADSDGREVHAVSEFRDVQRCEHLVGHQLHQQSRVFRGQGRNYRHAAEPVCALGGLRIARWNAGPPYADFGAFHVLNRAPALPRPRRDGECAGLSTTPGH